MTDCQGVFQHVYFNCKGRSNIILAGTFLSIVYSIFREILVFARQALTMESRPWLVQRSSTLSATTIDDADDEGSEEL